MNDLKTAFSRLFQRSHGFLKPLSDAFARSRKAVHAAKEGFRSILDGKRRELREEGQALGKRFRTEPYSRGLLVTLFAVGMIAGAGLKLAAAHTFTIGYQDYTVARGGEHLDLNALTLPDPNQPSERQTASGPMCIETAF
jgi:hypothetical protein